MLLESDELPEIFLRRHEIQMVDDPPLLQTESLYYMNSSRYVDLNVWDVVPRPPLPRRGFAHIMVS
ncbi:unnamed protein product [Arabis nemorensis]|uniref:Uncharacterized protein n=1 Tax=Arabis nemorensis TaxID=586526 RepID=A0A565B1X5_9BRAS|nr:unnamed protein product [Arabis nemorensis]